MKSEQIYKPFAIVALKIKRECQKIEKKYNEESDPFSKAILKKQKDSLTYLISVCFRITGDLTPAGVSKKAKNYIDDNQLGDVFEIGWYGQPKFEKKKNRSECILKHEHKTPIISLTNKLKEVDSVQESINTFMNQEIVWVHKEEDKLLPKSDRPDSDEAYRNAGLEVLKNPNPVGHIFKKQRKK